jgi:hypothetical protein
MIDPDRSKSIFVNVQSSTNTLWSLQIKIFVAYSNNFVTENKFFVSRNYDAVTKHKIFVSRKFVIGSKNKIFSTNFLYCTVLVLYCLYCMKKKTINFGSTCVYDLP